MRTVDPDRVCWILSGIGRSSWEGRVEGAVNNESLSRLFGGLLASTAFSGVTALMGAPDRESEVVLFLTQGMRERLVGFLMGLRMTSSVGSASWDPNVSPIRILSGVLNTEADLPLP